MIRKFLEDMALTKEQVDKILDENSTDIGKVKGDLDKLQAKLTTTEAELAQLSGNLKERDKQLETLKNATGDVEGLKKQITDLQTANSEKDKAHAAELTALKLNTAVDAALSSAKAKNTKAVRALLDLDKAELGEDGAVKGLAEQIKKLQGAEDSKFLFDEVKKPTMKGASPAATGVEEPDTKVDVSGMTYEEMAAYMEANPGVQI